MNSIIPMELRLSALAILVLFLSWVIRLIRRQRLSVRDSLAWLLTTLLAIVVTVFPDILVAGSRLVGIHVPANAFFAGGILYLAVNVLASTLAISEGAGRVRRLTQECALLRAELEQLRRDVGGRSGASGG
jgi:hypothetical protein